MNRSAINQALSKSLAYKTAGKHLQADLWAGRLLVLLSEAGINPIGSGNPLPESPPTPVPNRKRQSFDSYFSN